MGFFASVIHRFHQQRLSHFLRDKNGSHLELSQRKELIWSGIMMNHGHRGLANHVHKEAHATHSALQNRICELAVQRSWQGFRHAKAVICELADFFGFLHFFSRIFALFLRICAFFADKVRCSIFHLRSPIRAKGAKSHICENIPRKDCAEVSLCN